MVLDLIWLGVICFLVPALAEYAGIRKKSVRGFNWIAIAGLMFLLAALFSSATLTFWENFVTVALYGFKLFQIIGWIFALAGTIIVTLDFLKK